MCGACGASKASQPQHSAGPVLWAAPDVGVPCPPERTRCLGAPPIAYIPAPSMPRRCPHRRPHATSAGGLGGGRPMGQREGPDAPHVTEHAIISSAVVIRPLYNRRDLSAGPTGHGRGPLMSRGLVRPRGEARPGTPAGISTPPPPAPFPRNVQLLEFARRIAQCAPVLCLRVDRSLTLSGDDSGQSPGHSVLFPRGAVAGERRDGGRGTHGPPDCAASGAAWCRGCESDGTGRRGEGLFKFVHDPPDVVFDRIAASSRHGRSAGCDRLEGWGIPLNWALGSCPGQGRCSAHAPPSSQEAAAAWGARAAGANGRRPNFCGWNPTSRRFDSKR